MGSGNQALLHLECKEMKLFIQMKTQLGAPADSHFTPNSQRRPHGSHDGHGHLHRKKGAAQKARDRARAAAHRAKQDEHSPSAAATADVTEQNEPPSTSPTPPPISPTAPAGQPQDLQPPPPPSAASAGLTSALPATVSVADPAESLLPPFAPLHSHQLPLLMKS